MRRPPPPDMPLPPPPARIPDTSLGLSGWLFLAAFAVTGGGAAAFLGCTAAQGKRAEQILTKIGCTLLGVFSHDEQVATLCEDIAPEVEAEIAAAVADRDVKPDNLLGHRGRRRHRVRLAEHFPGRDPAETIEAEYLPHALRVLARRQGQPRPEVAAMPWDGGAR